ncbi:TRAP transporter small permease [Halocynthiibacter sp. C4]|uniref:TRAP transporter small permease n=1 Tax=Halocynthiibacter sp. C4 TaxID=2992758 RepID=UPI00237B9F04|nr:TRAP transporter small permease [Halocynthiibacter sp. C4]MDE0589329.1 TRAP transporter small permease [Halocynthiibacter sp. C4]
MHPPMGATRMDRIEETLIAIILGSMTLITFANVFVRKAFNGNILWALEATVFLFAWLVLLGASYAVKKGSHLGVDAIINILSPSARRIMGLISVSVCIVFSFLLLKGAWDYWANFANLPQTEGRWFPLGFQEDYRHNGWFETNDIPHPFFLNWMADVFNEGEAYEKLPRMVPYMVLPLSMLLLLIRFIQAGIAIWRGETDRIVASHEVEDEIAEVRERLGEHD